MLDAVAHNLPVPYFGTPVSLFQLTRPTSSLKQPPGTSLLGAAGVQGPNFRVTIASLHVSSLSTGTDSAGHSLMFIFRKSRVMQTLDVCLCTPPGSVLKKKVPPSFMPHPPGRSLLSTPFFQVAAFIVFIDSMHRRMVG